MSLSIDLHTASMSQSRERAIGSRTSGVLALGDAVTWRAVHFRIPWRMTSKITEYDPPNHFVDEQVRGPFAWFRHEHRYEPISGGTRMTDHVAFQASFGPLGRLAERLVLGEYVAKLIDARNAYLRAESSRTKEPMTGGAVPAISGGGWTSGYPSMFHSAWSRRWRRR
jgi:ligand-binding SRPBCC domain-containing protein